ncbi:MAG: hypothetical protein OXO50_06985, partial [Caldilineaceae bacterium]|nr:hypothetical protein [Caldilineaceae bacterium]
MNLLWWREPKLRHWGTSISASRGSGELAAYSGVLTLAPQPPTPRAARVGGPPDGGGGPAAGGGGFMGGAGV